jgi:C_GCAxxG_C_C family probable redox protein
MDSETIKEIVRKRYGDLATMKTSPGCGCGSAGGCCSPGTLPLSDMAAAIGYSGQDASSAPQGSNLGLGCGNPRSIAALKTGETVLDLGSGAGFDCFLAAQEVGLQGKVIGVDMTPEMVAKARENARKQGPEAYPQVEFRLGEIEHLPAADNSVDVIISNCVINLSADKEKVFKEAHRVLKPGGRLAILDVLAVAPVPEAVRHDLAAISACVGGAASVDQIMGMLEKAGFERIRINPLEESRQYIDQWLPGRNAGSYVRSATIEAAKPLDDRSAGSAGGGKKAAVENRQIRQRVYQDFEAGRHCAEAVSKTVLELFYSQPTTSAVRCAAGFGGGIAGTFEEVCGALSGGVLALGLLLGRTQPDANHLTLGNLTRQFRERFIAEFGSTHCTTLRKGFMEKNDPLGCPKLSAQSAVILAKLLYRFESEKDAAVETWAQGPEIERPKDNCPFKAASGKI